MNVICPLSSERIISADTSALNRLARSQVWASSSTNGEIFPVRRLADQSALSRLTGTTGLEDALRSGGGAGRDISGATRGSRTTGRAEASLDSSDLNGLFTRLARSSVGVFVVG